VKRTGLALALLLLAGGLLADPLFCCALLGEKAAAFSAPAMACCAEKDSSGCAPKVERALDRPQASPASVSPVATASAALSVPLPDAPAGSPDLRVVVRVDRPPRPHLLNSQFRI
jgi:hypothetical protein